MLELIFLVLFFIFAVVLHIVLLPFCLMVVLGLFGIQVGFWACVAVVIVLRFCLAVLGGK